jgi:hypothetical protein
MAKPNVSHPLSLAAKPGAPANGQDELKTLPIAEVEKCLGSSPQGLT